LAVKAGPLRVAVVGAGAVGRVLAGHLAEAGHRVLLQARPGGGARSGGVRLAKKGCPERAVAVPGCEALPRGEAFDVVFIATRADQLPAALEQVRAAGVTGGALVLCMPVWGPDPAYLVRGFRQACLLFPGFGARVLASGTVEYEFSRRPTELGPLEGPPDADSKKVVRALAETGLPIVEKEAFGHRYTALTAVGGPFAVALAKRDFDFGALSADSELRTTAARAAAECLRLADLQAPGVVGQLPWLGAVVVSPLLAVVGPLLARRARQGGLDFLLGHRRKMAPQDRSLLRSMEAYGRDRGVPTPALSRLLEGLA
jgi:ketopantoate reductase